MFMKFSFVKTLEGGHFAPLSKILKPLYKVHKFSSFYVVFYNVTECLVADMGELN